MNNSNLPPLNWLRAFESAARHLSFTQAAAELNLTQSAISQHVRSLEGFLGRELFIRRTRALMLSEAGANYLPTVREAFDLLAHGTQAMTRGDRGKSIILQCNMAFSVFCLAPRLHNLHAAFPWLRLNIVTPIWDPERHAEHANVEIRFGRPAEMSENAIPLPRDRFYPICHPDYQQGQIDLETATLMDCSGIMGNWETWYKSQGKPFNRANEVHLSSTYSVSISAALAGAGLAMAHDTLVVDLLQSGQLIRPFDHRPELLEAYHIIPPASHADTPATRAFMSWMAEEFLNRDFDA
ncbi:Glycine cleavage system transcriptional activator [Roseovarius albus]|uniref:Glycine cleavage system transcriptional activator n=1 Tax=Roseovarius albus TaxID=1247867 RepID=A0A1X6YAP2_9RHOB|nr:LysR family transcriptional regulator [Roseovarius albus]SLN15136.1 Glycine cleavage system transcriptional activator [Roseovarius albus]